MRKFDICNSCVITGRDSCNGGGFFTVRKGSTIRDAEVLIALFLDKEEDKIPESVRITKKNGSFRDYDVIYTEKGFYLKKA